MNAYAPLRRISFHSFSAQSTRARSADEFSVGQNVGNPVDILPRVLRYRVGGGKFEAGAYIIGHHYLAEHLG